MRTHHRPVPAAIITAVVAVTVTLALALSACGPEQSGPAARRDRDPAASRSDVDAVAAALNAFAFDLAAQLRQADPDANLWFSPHSIRTVLAMALAGANGPTRNELRRVLHLDLPDERLFPALNALDLSVTTRDDVTIEYTNWVADFGKVALRPTYTDALGKHFGAGVEQMNGNPAEGARRINDAVRNATKGRIDKLVNPDDLNNIVAVLLNAVYFKGEWVDGFEEEFTRPEPFQLLDGTTTSVPMMSTMTKRTRFATTDDWTVVDVPYKGKMAMTILMPDEGKFDQVVSQLDGATWDDAVRTLQGGEVILHMPKWEIRPSNPTNITDPLRALGLDTMFEETRADFSGISDTPLFFSWVKHRADVTVDEKGTVAAAATGGGAEATAAPISDTVTIDKPFVVTIRDLKTGAILFLGQVTNPTAGGS